MWFMIEAYSKESDIVSIIADHKFRISKYLLYVHAIKIGIGCGLFFLNYSLRQNLGERI
jgi:hypothetical protein